MTKKKIIIISAAVVILLLSVFLIWKYLGSKNNKSTAPVSNNVTENQPTGTLSGSNDGNPASNRKIVDTSSVNRLFAEKFSDTNNEQLESFSKIASLGNMEECTNLTDLQSRCGYYFSLYQGNDSFCGDVEDKKLQFDCYQELIVNNLSDRFEKCNHFSAIDIKTNCLNNLFWAINQTADCAIFDNFDIRQSCLDSISFKTASKQDKAACSELQDQSLKAYCEQSFTPGDFDKDGLIDSEEIKLGTDPYQANTDGDEYNDKEEIDKGYNPCGTGKLPNTSKLVELCTNLRNK